MYKPESEPVNYSSELNLGLNNLEQFNEVEEECLPEPGPMPGPCYQPETVSYRDYQPEPMPCPDYQPAPMPCSEDLTLARSYVVYQKLGSVFTPAEALKHATLFPELVRPYP